MKRINAVKIIPLMLCVSVHPVWAEDIEIYTNANTGVGAVRPNILFILDTSGSMADTIDVMEPSAMPISSVDYSLRIGACFNNSRIYKLPTGTLISDVTCSSTYLNSYYNMSQNQCQAAVNAFDTAGYLMTDWSQWKPTGTGKGWNKLSTSTSDTNFLECVEDNGVHGNGTTATYLNYSSTTQPYTTTVTSWNSLGSSKKNVQYTLYSGNYMNYLVTTANATPTSKLDIMRNVVENVLFGVEGVNIGLMKYNYRGVSGASNDGGVMKYPIIDVAATRNDLSNMKNWDAKGGTPLSESLFEAYRVFAGAEKYFAARSSSEPTEGTALLNGEPKNYDSPVDADAAACQRQFIVLLSDGWPDGDASNTTDKGIIESTIGQSCDAPGVLANYPTYTIDASQDNGKCLDDFAGWMSKTGFPAYLGNGVSTTDNIKVTTYGIGFGTSVDVMRDMAEEGGGKYYQAYNSTELTEAILDIIAEIKTINTTFTSPAVSVNAFNRTTHREELYYTVFSPSTTPHWVGNLKRFKLKTDASDNSVSIVDANDQSAVDDASGFFRPSATSFWTVAADAPDGDDSRKGGAAGMLTNQMNVYTNVAGDDLSAAANAVASANVSYAQLGISTDSTYRDTLIKWARGMDVNLENDTDGNDDATEARRLMADPLHASPVLVQYGGTPTNPDMTVFVVTNDGYLHAIDTATGKEIFSFVPQELLGNLNKAYVNDPAAGKLYGLDGSIATWVNDQNKVGEISGSDHVYLYFGMGRGGRNVYAMDVTNRSAPKMLWTIRGGVDADFTALGHTFSTPIHRKIRLGGVEQHVVIFGGGYDLDQDNVFKRTVDDVGRAIYIVDAETGKLLWRGDSSVSGLEDMDYSIPSDVAAVDVHGDGFIDRLYVGDMGGQLWRIYIDNEKGKTSSDMDDLVTPYRMADLAGDVDASNRRFFYAPDVALMKSETEADFLAVVMTSGNRSHPLNKQVQDRVFMLKDRPVKAQPTSSVVIVENDVKHDLIDTTPNVLGELSAATDAEKEAHLAQLAKGYGWYFDFLKDYGEKGLARPLIVYGLVYFTTYTPPDTSVAPTNMCGVDQGNGWLYEVAVDSSVEGYYDPNPGTEIRADGKKDARIVDGLPGGIPPEPKSVVPPGTTDGRSCIIIGTRVTCPGVLQSKEKVYWFSR